jgi:hypothetical protein
MNQVGNSVFLGGYLAKPWPIPTVPREAHGQLLSSLGDQGRRDCLVNVVLDAVRAKQASRSRLHQEVVA